MLLNIGISFMGFGLFAFILAVIVFGFLVLLDKDVLDSKVDKLFAAAMISWAVGTACLFINFIMQTSHVAN